MNIDWFTFTAQIVNFAVLVYLLNRFLYGPITRAMSQREEGIASRLHMAEKKEQDAKTELERYRQLSADIEQQRSVLFEQARTESENTRQTLVEDARTEVQSRRKDWLDSLQREQAAMINLVRQRAGDQIVVVSREALSQLADVSLEQQTLATFLRQLGQLPEELSTDMKSKVAKNNFAKIVTAFEVTPAWKSQICDSLDEHFGFKQVDFVTAPDLICGIELHVNGSKIGWSIQEYLESLTDELQGLVAGT